MSSSAVPHLDAALQTIGGRWELCELIARGGMASIYRGRHVVTRQSAAIKVLESEAALNARQRFGEEVRIAASIGHPGVVQVFDAGVDEASGSSFLVMELLSGRTLGECMDDEPRDQRTLLRFVRLLLEPLAAAHDARVVHRDLKPENVFVSDDPPNQIKLLDFGIARGEESPQLTQAGIAVGTPSYMSPEQALGKEVGAAADVWAVGVMLYEILAGVHPFPADGSHGVIVAACTRPHERLCDLDLGVDPVLSNLVDRCLAKEASLRPHNAGLLLLDLNKALGLASVPPSYRTSLPSLTHGPPPVANPNPITAPSLEPGAGLIPSNGTAHSRPSSLRMMALVGFFTTGVGALLLAYPKSKGGAVLIALLLLSGVLYLATRPPPKARSILPPRRHRRRPSRLSAPEEAQKVTSSPVRGPIDAPVSLVFVADLSSPASRKAKATLDRLLNRFPDQLRVVFRHAPVGIPGYQIAQAAVEAHVQGGDDAFWRLIDLLLRGYRRITLERVEFLFDQLNLNIAPLRHALQCQRHWLMVDDDRELAATLGVTAVPGFILEGRVFDRDTPVAVLADAIEAALSPPRTPEDLGTLVEDIENTSGRSYDQIVVQWSALADAQLQIVRSRAQAKQRAERLLLRAQAETGDFEKLAATFSDGLAYVPSFEALSPQTKRDAFRMSVGALSGVIETEEGYHILFRRS